MVAGMIDIRWLILIVPIAVIIGYSTGMIYTLKNVDRINAMVYAMKNNIGK